MSQENVEVVRNVWADWSRPLTASLDSFDPEIAWYTRTDVPDAGVYRGFQGVATLTGFWRDTFVDLRLEADEFIDGGDCVIVPSQVRGHGKASHVSVDMHYTFVCKVKDRRIAEVREFADRVEALEAVGLSE